MSGIELPANWTADEARAVVDGLLELLANVDRKYGDAIRRRERELEQMGVYEEPIDDYLDCIDDYYDDIPF